MDDAEVVVGGTAFDMAMDDANDNHESNNDLRRRVPSLYSWGWSPSYDLVDHKSSPAKNHNEGDKEDEERVDVKGTTMAHTSTAPTLIPPQSRVGRWAGDIVNVSIGESHIGFVTSSGSLWMWGDNSSGAVDPSTAPVHRQEDDNHNDNDNSRKKKRIISSPMLLESIMSLLTTKIIVVACGLDHTAILTEHQPTQLGGSVLTFGGNRHGQLGHRRRPKSTSSSSCPSRAATGEEEEEDHHASHRLPAVMVLPEGQHALDVTCGDGFTLVATTRLRVYICGKQIISGYIQHNSNNSTSEQPQGQPPPQQQQTQDGLAHEHPYLQGLPLVAVRAGRDHAVVITKHGTVYSWGNNPTGACGRPVPTFLPIPVPFHILPRTPAATTGTPAGSHPQPENAVRGQVHPHMPTVLDDDSFVVEDAACGQDTTILVTTRGELLVAGSNDKFQLGIVTSGSQPEQQPPPPQHPILMVQRISHPKMDRRFVSVKAGSCHTVLLDDHGDVWSMGHGSPLSLCLTGKAIGGIVAGGNHSLAIVNNHFNNDKPVAHTQVRGLGDFFRYPSVMNMMSLDRHDIDQMYEANLLDFKALWKYNRQTEIPALVSIMERGMVQGLQSLSLGHARRTYPETVRCLLMYLQCPLFREHGGGSKEQPFNIKFDVQGYTIYLLCETILDLPYEGYNALVSWMKSMYSGEAFVLLLVKPLINQLDHWIDDGNIAAIPSIVEAIRLFQNVAEQYPQELPSKREDFYSSGVEEIDYQMLYNDLVRYKQCPKKERNAHFFLCAHSFLMSPQFKRKLLQLENQMNMVHAAQASGLRFDMERQQLHFNPHFILSIDRANLLQRTLQAVASAAPWELRKSLKVVFEGEDGIDAGGVTKEFFQLLVEQLFDINTGMWSTRFGEDVLTTTWFNTDCTWNQDGYYIVGIVVGLAVYNSVILDVHFPSAIYRKLLGLPLGLKDMVDPDIQKGLQALLDYEQEDVEEVFCLTFEITWSSLGLERKQELKPGGSEISVTSDNKREYVMLYVNWLLVDSIQLQYLEFERGFQQVMEGSSLHLLRPDELELLVVGNSELDFAALQKNTQYDGGFHEHSPVVRNLWQFVHESPRETQLKFLRFSTGTTKAPIGGLGAIPFKIQRAGPDSMLLPTSHTCFNTLLVPDYGDNYEKLKNRLGRAIMECEGFGLQ